MTDILARSIGLLLAATALVAAAPPAKHPISAERLSADVKILASDEFQGRAPGTPGEAKTVEWLVARLKSLGLEPAAPGGTWTQDVPLIRTQLGAGTTAVVT